MEFILKLLLVCIQIGIGAYILKYNFVKIKKPYSYYIAMQDIISIANKRFMLVFVPILIFWELLTSLLFLLTVHPFIAATSGVFIQIFYISIMLLNLNKKSESNCGCFPLNAPKRITSDKIVINILVLLLMIVIFGISRRIA